MMTFTEIRSPPRTLSTPSWRRRRRTLCPFQLLQGRQCLFEVRSALHWHSIGTCLVRTKSPITFVIQMVCMIVVRKSIHLSTNIFVSIIFNHSIAELFISYKSVMDTLEEPLLALLFQLIGDVIFPVSRLFTVSVSVTSSFLYDVVGNWKEVHGVLDQFLIFLSSFTQEVSVCAVDNANVPVWWTYFALRFGFRVE